MTTFVVLLRGVNVGRGNRVPMAALRELLEALEYRDVATLLNSGNAVFSGPSRGAAAHAKAIHERLVSMLGIDVPVIVKSSKDLGAVEAENPFARRCQDPSRLLVAFAQTSAPLQGLQALAALLRPGERFELGRHAAYLLCPDGILASTAATALLGKLGRACTTRNWATVQKLAALLPN